LCNQYFVHHTPQNKIYGSHLQHKNEKASPGFYSVKLDDENILAELTTTTRVGFHRYTFPSTNEAEIILDLKHRDQVLENEIKIEDSITVSGLRRSKAWANNQYVYFVIKFSTPFKNYGIYKDDVENKGIRHFQSTMENIKAYFEFAAKANEAIMVKVAISAVSIEGAKNNLAKELPGWNFEKTKTEAEKIWNKELSRIDVSSTDVKQLRTFYSALYHSANVPNFNQDVDGK